MRGKPLYIRHQRIVWIIRHRSPLATYFPETIEVELARSPPIPALHALYEQAGFSHIDERTVELRYPLTDIRAYRDKAYSALHLISEEAFQRGIARMERDLQAGSLPCVSRYTLLWGSKKQEAGGRRQEARGRKQEAESALPIEVLGHSAC